MVNLPQELIEEILVRLPVKSLLRFKCVSKSWLSLISDPHFAYLHFERYSQRTHRIFLTIASQNRSIDLNASLHDDSAVVSLRSLFNPEQNARIAGSCRGLLLLYLDRAKYIVWNPSIDVSREIPLSPLWQNACLYGFGYDASTDDYLIVVASFAPFDPYQEPCRVALLEIFSFRANSWTKLEGLNFPSIFCPMEESDCAAGSFLNGAIHWSDVCLETPYASHGAIIAFDLTERNLRQVPMPDYDSDSSEYGQPMVLWGCLSLTCVNDTFDQIEIWVMRDYGAKSSWTKLITMSLVDIPTNYFSPIGLTKDGRVIGIDNGPGLMICNYKGELLEHRQYHHDPQYFGSTAWVYTESLLSPQCDHKEKVEHRQCNQSTRRIRC